MGNVNGREDGSNSPAGIEEEEKGNGILEALAAPMAHSPPHSPTSTHSPLMFTPQVPVLPLRRPDEMHTSSPSWLQSTIGNEDGFPEKGIPTMITWSYGGKEVAVEGSWDNWKTRFIVDGQWRYAPDLPWVQDGVGNANNVLDLQDYVPEDIKSISSFEPPQSPESSYSNLLLGAEDFAKEPPLVPPHLQLPLLNLPTSHMEIPPLSRPKHVILNHLYIQKGKNGQPVVALGSTHRFQAKYVTVVLYKPVQR
ncbi:hypothetical protein V6N11_081462 [Hibiscus sabdariffa]|uniref:Association with the SNF1 complex (ASC) domain-containing protein n=1 Tax=Hibiscus sabdariffa TaxID=183260 RepID=A0ABR2N6H0_9ROSI